MTKKQKKDNSIKFCVAQIRRIEVLLNIQYERIRGIKTRIADIQGSFLLRKRVKELQDDLIVVRQGYDARKIDLATQYDILVDLLEGK